MSDSFGLHQLGLLVGFSNIAKVVWACAMLVTRMRRGRRPGPSVFGQGHVAAPPTPPVRRQHLERQGVADLQLIIA